MKAHFETSRSAVPMRAEAFETAIERARKRRQDALLDDALLETFPASDPVSVICVA